MKGKEWDISLNLVNTCISKYEYWL